MKTKLTISAVLLFLTIAFISGLPTEEEKSISNMQLQPGSLNQDNEFIIGSMNNANDIKTDPGTGYHYANIKDSLLMNTWHRNTGPNSGWFLPSGQVDPNDRWDGDTSLFGPNVRWWINNNNTNEFRTLMDRPIVEYLAFGQRSDYQCEKEELVDPDFWYYTYYNSIDNDSTINDTTDNSSFGNNQKVKLCLPSLSSAGYILDSLKANHEQANKVWGWWISDSASAWYIKPRIRIDPDFAYNNRNDTVCRIDIINWNGDIVKKVGILGRHFLLNDEYDGRYLMEYNFDIHDSNLVVNPGDRLCPGPAKRTSQWSPNEVKTDFKVYWYGTCEMWIDYIRVENEQSVLLHSGSPTIIDRINKEVEWALIDYKPSKPNNFYIEEFEFNTMSCIKRVNEIIDSCSDGKLSLMVNLNYNLYKQHIPNGWDIKLDRHFIKGYLIDSAKIKYLVTGSYALEGWEEGDTNVDNERLSIHPSTLNAGGYNKGNGVLSYDSTPVRYDNWLQRRLDEGIDYEFIYIMKLSDSLSKMTNDLRIINLHQSHLWWHAWHKLKEPTNEEAELMANLAISYGARGILYFCYEGYGDMTDESKFYYRGLTERNYHPRQTNVYGQQKFKKYGEMNEKYAKWGPYLMSFDDENRHSYIYRLENERNDLIQSTYFLSARTFYPGSGTPTCSPADSAGINPYPDSQQSLTYDCPEKTYLQVALFDDNLDNFDKYFMIINRRCSPFIDSIHADSNGGRRLVRILFDANDITSFPNYNNWNIIDLQVEGDQKALTFDKRVTRNLDLGWYMPGEGRLYKIIPAKI